ncbi:MAG: DoxX family protein [Alphaproteobacteria bacterium]
MAGAGDKARQIDRLDDGKWRMALALLFIRLALGYFFAVWGINKLLTPDQTAEIFGYFYGMRVPPWLPDTLGVAETALAAAIVVGLWRRPAYLAGLLVHTTTIVVTARSLAMPFLLEDGFPVNRLYAASVPTWAALIALYMLRADDRWSIDAWRRRAQPDER